MLLAACLVETQRAGEIDIAHRTAVSVPCEVGYDLLRARQLFALALRIADENLRPAGRWADAGRLRGPDDLDTKHSRLARDAARLAQGLEFSVGLREGALDKGDPDLVRAGLHVRVDVLDAGADLLDRRRLLLVDGLEVLRAAQCGLEELHPIERHDQR